MPTGAHEEAAEAAEAAVVAADPLGSSGIYLAWDQSPGMLTMYVNLPSSTCSVALLRPLTFSSYLLDTPLILDTSSWRRAPNNPVCSRHTPTPMPTQSRSTRKPDSQHKNCAKLSPRLSLTLMRRSYMILWRTVKTPNPQLSPGICRDIPR